MFFCANVLWRSVKLFVADLFCISIKGEPFLFFRTLALIEPLNDVVKRVLYFIFW